MQMIFIYGAPAAGKLTVGRAVAKRTGFALFHHHLIVDALLAVFRFGSPEFVRLREQFWSETINSAAQAGRSLVFTYCPEPTLDPDLPSRLAVLVAREGGTTLFVRLDVSDEEQEKRLVAPSRAGTKLRRVEVLRAWREDFQAALAAMPTAALSIDTTVTSPEAAAGRIVELVR